MTVGNERLVDYPVVPTPLLRNTAHQYNCSTFSLRQPDGQIIELQMEESNSPLYSLNCAKGTDNSLTQHSPPLQPLDLADLSKNQTLHPGCCVCIARRTFVEFFEHWRNNLLRLRHHGFGGGRHGWSCGIQLDRARHRLADASSKDQKIRGSIRRRYLSV